MKLFHESRKIVFDTDTQELLTYEEYENQNMKKYGLYDVCECNHEFLQHNQKCSAIVPVGKDSYRGYVAPEIPSKTCECKKFILSTKNSGSISSHEER